MISQTSEYALRAVVCLATHPDIPMKTAQIANLTNVPASYLSKVLLALSRHGIVSSQRGLYGGFMLEKPPGGLSVLDVVNAVDPIKRIHTCPLKLEYHGSKLCPLHYRLDQAAKMVEEAFAQTKIAELLQKRKGSRPLKEELYGGDCLPF